MAKQYKVKDINNNGKIDGWEQGKYDAINNSATKMGYSMKMGSKENYSPTNFKTKDAMLMAQSPMMMDDPKKDPKKGATVTSGKKGGFTQKTQGPVTGGVVNTLDEVIITQPVDKKQPKNKKQKKKFKYTKVGKFLGKLGPSNTFKYVTKNKGRRTVFR